MGFNAFVKEGFSTAEPGGGQVSLHTVMGTVIPEEGNVAVRKCQLLT